MIKGWIDCVQSDVRAIWHSGGLENEGTGGTNVGWDGQGR